MTDIDLMPYTAVYIQVIRAKFPNKRKKRVATWKAEDGRWMMMMMMMMMEDYRQKMDGIKKVLEEN